VDPENQRGDLELMSTDKDLSTPLPRQNNIYFCFQSMKRSPCSGSIVFNDDVTAIEMSISGLQAARLTTLARNTPFDEINLSPTQTARTTIVHPSTI
jgi:hypothetical protein